MRLPAPDDRWFFCRSELAREKLTGAASIQEARVIVDVLREQARSYSIPYIETKKKLAISAIPTAHTSERKIAQSAR